MQSLRKFLLTARTLAYLKPIQLWGQLRNRLPRRVPSQLHDFMISVPCGEWQVGIPKHFAYLGGTRFHFINTESDVSNSKVWWESQNNSLWNYNLNYFEWLNQGRQKVSPKDASCLIRGWIDFNLPGSSRAWDPYPVSLRIINWIRFFLENKSIEGAHHSLAYQARWLSGRLETHLLGNHYLVNGVALLFAGVYFSGKDANEWLEKGWSIVYSELREQVLKDGGHYERSPMYHSLILEDVMNLLNLAKTYPDRAPTGLEDLCKKTANAMLSWLKKMTYPDGSFPLFNDAAYGVAAPLQDLESYAQRLSVGFLEEEFRKGVCVLEESGFARMQNGMASVFAEIGGPGPSYQPGHSHAGTLGFELMLKGQRILVDTGTNTYEEGEVRDAIRSTSAHNTLTIDGLSSSETWSSFRVGRRASGRCVAFESNNPGGVQQLCAEHNGYKVLGKAGLHRRTWALSEKSLEISDRIENISGCGNSEIRFHFNPEVTIVRQASMWLIQSLEIQIRMPMLEDWEYFIDDYHSSVEFGSSTSGKCIIASIRASKVNVTHAFYWAEL